MWDQNNGGPGYNKCDHCVSVRVENKAERLLEDPCGFFQYGELEAWRCCRGRSRAVAETAGRKELLLGDGGSNPHAQNYRHTLVSTQREVHAHLKASHHVFACIHISPLIHSPFPFSLPPALIPSDGMLLSNWQ